MTASSDGQFFPAARQGEAMNFINAKYGSEPGLKAYTHISDQFGPFATQNIPATVSEAPYTLDGLLMTRRGGRSQSSMPTPAGSPITSVACGAARVPVHPAYPRPAIQMALPLRPGLMPPSQPLKKFAACPRQHELALALREIGRAERTLFVIEWLLDADMQRWVQIGLNKGEAHYALKNALRIGHQGEIRDRTAEGQHYRMTGLNLLATIIIYWNTKHLGQAVAARQRAGLNCDPALLAHISPLKWAHILLTGEYRCGGKAGQSCEVITPYFLPPSQPPNGRTTLIVITKATTGLKLKGCRGRQGLVIRSCPSRNLPL